MASAEARRTHPHAPSHWEGERAIDWLVVTAANAAQARGYRAQLAARERSGSLTVREGWMVVADPGGRRVGSGGSTFVVLLQLARRLAREQPGARRFADLFAGRRMVVIHSGGDSRRVPAYAAEGKIFTPLPCEVQHGRPAAMFDLLMDDLAGVELGAAGGVLIAAGDVLLGVGRYGLRLDGAGVVGVAFRAASAVGSRHGVYVLDRRGRVTDFLQKPDRATASRHGATDRRGRVMVDSGLLALEPDTVERWLKAVGCGLARGVSVGTGLLSEIVGGRAPAIDLYEQVLMAMPARRSLPRYLASVVKGPPGRGRDRDRRLLTGLNRALHRSGLRALAVPRLDFVHVGTSAELLRRVTRSMHAGRVRWPGQGVRVMNCDGPIAEGSRGPSLVEGCRGAGRIVTRGRNIVVGVPAGARGRIRVPRGWGLVCLPVGPREWAAVAFGIDDDFKTATKDGGPFGGRRPDEFLRRRGVVSGELWGRSARERSLWTARLWSVGGINDVLARTLWMWDRRESVPAAWRRARRWSMAELVRRVDHSRLIGQRAELQREERLAHLSERLAADRWLSAAGVVADLGGSRDAARAMAVVGRLLLRRRDAIDEARLLRLAGVIDDKYQRARVGLRTIHRENLDDAALVAVARAVPFGRWRARRPVAAIAAGEVVEVDAPVRIDLAGGWSDTPPICQELGGTVVNAAITLNGRRPVRVTARLIDGPCIRLTSVDLGRAVELREAADLWRHRDPRDWAALAKGSLVLAGIVPERGASLARSLRSLGGGLELTMRADVPKGSGLGTSSILGAALLACLDRVVGERLSVASLIRRTSVLEQMVSTAGGWQDQAGGIVPGVKVLRTRPGAEQVPRIERLPLETGPASALAGRMMLYYTGYRRLARDILRQVVLRYLARDEDAVATIGRIKDNAEGMRAALLGRDADDFAVHLSRTWELKKRLDPGSTNARIEGIFDRVRPWLSGCGLPGAGGGGFVLMIARDRDAARRARRELGRRPPNAQAGFVEFAVDDRGMEVRAH